MYGTPDSRIVSSLLTCLVDGFLACAPDLARGARRNLRRIFLGFDPTRAKITYKAVTVSLGGRGCRWWLGCAPTRGGDGKGSGGSRATVLGERSGASSAQPRCLHELARRMRTSARSRGAALHLDIGLAGTIRKSLQHKCSVQEVDAQGTDPLCFGPRGVSIDFRGRSGFIADLVSGGSARSRHCAPPFTEPSGRHAFQWGRVSVRQGGRGIDDAHPVVVARLGGLFADDVPQKIHDQRMR